jgi:thiamine-monophosphate kinase
VRRGEFELIDHFFRDAGVARADVLVGIGDDGAVLRPPAGSDLVAVTDTLNEGVHFPAGCDARSVGHRALAVNLSDLAAMGAEPAWALLALTLPAYDESWLEAFTAGFAGLARTHGVALVGGDTTRGPLAVNVQALGFVPAGAGIRRGGAAAGDLLFVSGTPGEAAAGLAIELGEHQATAGAGGPAGAGDGAGAAVDVLRRRFLYPEPRLALGRALRGIASACIDVSDGLLGDLGKLAAASGCGAAVELEQLPISPALLRFAGRPGGERMVLTGGDDYELCFAAPPGRAADVAAAAARCGVPVTAIGALREGAGVELRRAGCPEAFRHGGFDHFAR